MKRVTIFAILLCLFLFSSPQGGIGGSNQRPTEKFVGCKGPYDEVDSERVYEWPFEYVGFNQYFSWGHPGIDLWAVDYEPITAAGYGFVELVDFMPRGYGNYVIISHGKGWQTLYGHMADVPPVKEGDYIYPGKIIGYAGSTGKSTGTHLHFEVRRVKDGFECFYDPRTVIDGSY